MLPVDVYTDGALVIDDGYDRANLNVPGVLHIECAAKWSQERPSQALPGRSSGSTARPSQALPLCNSSAAAAAADCVLATPLPLLPPPPPLNRPQGVALAARPPLPRDQV